MSGDCLYTVLPTIAVLLPLSSVSITDQILSLGIWAYLLIFIVILFTSTIVGGAIPDNTFLILIGAAAIDNELSMPWLVVVTVLGGFSGYEINYWIGRIFGLKICRGVCQLVLHDKNMEKALAMMDRYGPASLILSRFMPVLNLPSFVAGVNAMEYRRYVVFNLISSIFWCGVLLVLGYYIGSIAISNQYLDDLTDLFLIVMAVAIIVVLVMFARDYVNTRVAAHRNK
jgi:membrane-associated protein